MDFLEELGFGPTDVPVLLHVLSAALLVFMLLAAGILVYRVVQNAWDRRQRALVDAHATHIMVYLGNGEESGLRGVRASRALRDQIVTIAGTLSGELLVTQGFLYTSYGFALKDARSLRSSRPRRQFVALERCRTLRLPLPEEAWPYLLASRNWIFRWAVMDYLIAVKGKAALPWVMGFLAQKQNQHKGMLLHLFASMAAVSPEVLPVLVEHTDRDSYRELLFKTLAVYPCPGAECLVLQCLQAAVQTEPRTELLLAALAALAQHPAVESVAAVVLATEHADPAVRELAAASLGQLQDPASVAVLDVLALDGSYSVRIAAVEALYQFGPVAAAELAAIAAVPDHPSYPLLKHHGGQPPVAA